MVVWYLVWFTSSIFRPMLLATIICMATNPKAAQAKIKLILLTFQFLAFSYFYKEPKKFEGGQLYFPKYDYEVSCDNNSMIIFPGWVEHGVREVSIKESDYFEGWGRYAITSFFGSKPRTT